MSTLLGLLKEKAGVSDLELKDSSGSMFINDSGVYTVEIEKAFLMQSEGGAIGIYISYKGDVAHEETLWVTNKEQETFYNKNGKDYPMVGYVDAKKINYLLTGEMIDSLRKLATENRLVKHFKYVEDPENEGKKKKVENQIEAEVLIDWIGKESKILVQMVQKEGWDKQTRKPSGVGAVTKDGEPITEATIIDRFNIDNLTATESFKGTESVMYAKGLARIEKAPIRLFKPKGSPKANTKTTSTGVKVPAKPVIF
jgi:hypothetical protein